ncbi:hypothetical protein [Daejeonella sp.]|jgi:hypothetical protein|uniref:hypothetical protein n=1 Tax=Daejeonella sp. TaxID=2805397 RepID=UPI0037BEB0A8
MEIEVFVYKSNVKSNKLAERIIFEINKKFPIIRTNFDLEDIDKIYRLEATQLEKKEIEKFIRNQNIELIELE